MELNWCSSINKNNNLFNSFEDLFELLNKFLEKELNFE